MNPRPHYRMVLVLILASLTAANALHGQGVLAEIRGIVTDSSGQAIPKAVVTVLDVTKGWTRQLSTNEQGEYEIPELEADKFTLTAEAPGFQKSVRQGVILQTGQQAQINFTLNPGAVTETITVNANSPIAVTNSAALGTVVDEKKVEELPLNGRQFWQLAQLVPNAYPPIPNSSLSFRGGFNIAGQPEVNNNYILDGIDDSDEATMQPTVSPSVDGIQEFKVLTGVYEAEYGRFSGGQILITTKSGSNHFHGTAYEFFRNSALDAKNYFAPSGPIAALHRNDYGGSLGGPIKKNHTFFFATYEGVRLSQQTNLLTTVPTLQERSGNLSDLKNSHGQPVVPIDPSTGQPFPSDTVPINSISAQLLQYYPLPNRPANIANGNNYLFSETGTNKQDQFSARVDQNISQNNTVFVSYQYQNSNAFLPNNTLCGSSTLPGFGCTTPELDQAISVHDAEVFSPSVINEFRAGYNRIRTNRFLQDAADGDVLAQLGIPTSGSNGVGAQAYPNLGVPSIGVSGYATLGGATNLPQGRRDNSYNIVDSLSWIKGPHALKFGVDFKRFIYNLQYWQDGRGVFSFNGEYTGSALADFLLGDLRSTARDPGNPQVNSFTASTDFFAEDEWQVTHTLTFTYGLRYELDFPEGERQDRISTFDPVTGLVPVANGELLNIDPTTGQLVNVGTSPLIGEVWHLQTHNFAPRLGLAWQPFGDQKTVIRAGYGIFYDQVVAGNGISQMWRGIPFRIRQSFTNTPSNTVATWTNPYPSGVSNAGGFTPNGINPNYKTASVDEWSASVDRELQSDLSLELSYLGSHGNHLQESYNLNQPVPGPGLIQSRVPYSQWGAITWVDSNGESSYNSGSVRVERRYSQGLTLLASYTYSHSYDDAPYSGSIQFANPLSLMSEWAPSDFDIHNRFVTSFTYELPFGAGKPFGSDSGKLTRAFISGWQVNGILVLQSGLPFSVTTSKDISNTGLSSQFANLLPGIDPNVSNPTPAHWFNTSAFSDAEPAGTYAFGDAPRNLLRSGGIDNLDFGLYRHLRVTEGSQVEFRAELFNIFNHPDFAAPTANVESPSFGTVGGTTEASREIQLALKYIF